MDHSLDAALRLCPTAFLLVEKVTTGRNATMTAETVSGRCFT